MRVLFYLGLVFILIQVHQGFGKETKTCWPKFRSYVFVFVVNSCEVTKNQTLGKVKFNDCVEKEPALYAEDHRFSVQTDGTISATMDFRFHRTMEYFDVYPLDSKGKGFFARVVVIVSEHQDPDPNLQLNASPDVEMDLPVRTFPLLSSRLSRRKRDWVIPPINLLENDRGPFPKKIVQIKSMKSKEMKVFYNITGPGADLPPVGFFTIERESGWLSVAKPLDREAQDSYIITSYAVSSNGDTVEVPMELIFSVIDQNDNKPQFIQQIFEGSVPEGVPPGTSVMSVTAEDLDDPTTDNAILGYSIVSQEPKVPAAEIFTVNKQTGVISTITEGLNREIACEYKLIVRVADQEGAGLSNTATAVISVTDRNGNAPEFDPKKAGSRTVLTAHAIDRASGSPASNMTISVYKLGGSDCNQKWKLLAKGFTDARGHNSGLLTPAEFTVGTYKIRFETGEYWRQQRQNSIYPFVEIVISVVDQTQKYHIPLLLNPHSYSTYKVAEPDL